MPPAQVPPARLRRTARALVVGALLTAAAGCVPGGVLVPAGADQLEPCAAREPVAVSDLAAAGAPGCDMVGTVLVFPDGRELEVAAVGVVSGAESSDAPGEMHVVNWGVPGVGAALVDDETVQVWGSTPDAVDLQRRQLTHDGVTTPTPRR